MLLVFACVLLLALPILPAAAQETEAESGPTGPIDPAAGSWVLYSGQRVVPDQQAPQPFFLRVTYGYVEGAPQESTVMEARVEELDAEQRVTSSRTFNLQTKDRFYQDRNGDEEGFWAYWLPCRLEEGDTVTVGSGSVMEVEEPVDYDFRGDRYSAVRVVGEGREVLADQRTGLVFRLIAEGSDGLEISDTNMLAQYPLWGYYPDNKEVGERLGSMAESYPDLVEVSSLGKSMKDREIWLAHVTDFTSTEQKRSVYIDAAMEGDSPESCDLLLDFLDELLRRTEEEEAMAEMLRKTEIFAVPLVNPDGLQRWTAMPDPRESARLSSQAPRNGNMVRINRNFDIMWEEGSGNPASENYAGTQPFSESETQAVRGLLEDVPVSLYISLHTLSDMISAPWNWNSNPAANPEKGLYEGILSELSEIFPYPLRVGVPINPFTGSSTDWAYEGNGSSSPLCFDLYLSRPATGESVPEEARTELEELKNLGSLSLYAPHKEVIYHLMDNLQSYLAVDIVTGEPRAEVNVPLDLAVEIRVSGMRALPDAKARLILTNGSGLKLATLSEKDVELGDLSPGSSTQVTWSLEGRAGGTYTVEVVINSSYPEYDQIPGTYSSSLDIVISTQRTWLVLVLLTLLVLLILGLILLSMRKHQKKGKVAGGEEEQG